MTKRLPAELLVRRSDAVYNAHGYLTKVPVDAIVPFIEEFTEPGDTVLDPFAGSGMTGVAAAMCGRSAVLSDISTLGRHIGENYLNLVATEDFRAAASRAIEYAAHRLGKPPYRTACDACSEKAEVVRTVWSARYRCNHCGETFVYYEALEASGWQKRGVVCSGCAAPFSTRNADRVGEVPVLETVSCRCASRQLDQRASLAPYDSPATLGLSVPDVEIGAHREMFSRSALAKHGLTTVASFFSPRNLCVLAALREAIAREEDERIASKLMFGFTAALARASKRYQWSRKRPLNASNQTYYVAPIYYEWNVFDLFSRKTEALIRSDGLIRARRRQRGVSGPLPVRYETESASDLRSILPDESVDYVFTDPPFGSNIFYSDMNLFAEAWLPAQTDPVKEAVVHTTRARRAGAALRYEGLLTDAFTECRRVLRPHGRMTVVFSNSSGSMWALLQRALAGAGLTICADEIRLLDKGQRSVKGLASGVEGVVTCDLMLTLEKSQSTLAAEPRAPDAPLEETVGALLDGPGLEDLVSPSRVYVAAVRKYLNAGWDLSTLDLAAVVRILHTLGRSSDPKTGLFSADGVSFAS